MVRDSHVEVANGKFTFFPLTSFKFKNINYNIVWLEERLKREGQIEEGLKGEGQKEEELKGDGQKEEGLKGDGQKEEGLKKRNQIIN